MSIKTCLLLAAAGLALAACGAKTTANPASSQQTAGQQPASQQAPQPTSSQPTSSQPTSSQPTSSQGQPAPNGTTHLLLSAGFDVPRQEVAETDFTLSDLSGRKVSLSSFKGKLVVLSFWATWCGPCKQEIPSVEALYRKLSSEGFTVVAVDVGEKAQDVAAFVKSYNMTFPVLLDADGQVASTYDAGSIPTNYIVSRDGKLLARVVGYDGKEWTAPEKVDLFEKLLKL